LAQTLKIEDLERNPKGERTVTNLLDAGRFLFATRLRRALVLCLLLAPIAGGRAVAGQNVAGSATPADSQGSSPSEIRLGMSADFTAGARALGIELYRGAMACLLGVNQEAGVNGRKIVIKAYDDQYNPDQAIRNTLTLMNEDDVFALFGYVGTPTMNRTLPLLRMHQDKEFLLLFPFTGADTNRIPPYDQFSFNLRASYDQEAAGLVDHFINIHRTRIAVYYQSDAYGRAGWSAVRSALAKHGLEIAGEATYRRGTPFDHSYDPQVAIMQKVRPDAVICIATYAAAAGFVRDMRTRGVDCPIATISFVGSEAMLGLLTAATRTTNKDYSARLVSSEVVPSYYDDSLPAAREYREAMDHYRQHLMPANALLYPDGETPENEYTPLPYSFTSLEGYLDARLFVMILRRMGPVSKRADLERAVMGLGDFDLGVGQTLSFGGISNRRQASDQIYYTVAKGGRFIPFRESEWEAWAK
jgi:ABC-type branched-subunit amino acid transport system substrate-binding protein